MSITWTNERLKLQELTPWARNPRTITHAQAERLLHSFDKFGQVHPIAIGPGPENRIYDGHQRKSVLVAADEYGMDYEVDVRRASRELTEKEQEELTVMLHKGAAGQWDWDILANEFEFGDLTAWGFTEQELLGLDFGNTPDFAPVGADEQPRLDQKSPIDCPHCGESFVPK